MGSRPHATRDYYRTHPNDRLKYRARHSVHRAVRRGKVGMAQQCETCGLATKLHAHHYMGYERPLDVCWLCEKCHKVAHRKYAREIPWEIAITLPDTIETVMRQRLGEEESNLRMRGSEPRALPLGD